MKVALLVPPLGEDIPDNKRRIAGAIHVALGEGPDLMVLPETAFTGYQDRGEPEYDRDLCENLHGESITGMCELAKSCGTMISIGFFEKEDSHIFDTSILIDERGEILQHYRRVDPHWHHADADPEVYLQGTEVLRAHTDFGSFSTLICGDLYNDLVVRKTQELTPDFILFPLGRSLGEGVDPDSHLAEAREQICVLGATTLLVNFLEASAIRNPVDKMIGGAAIVERDGRVLAELSPLEAGILFFDFESRKSEILKL